MPCIDTGLPQLEPGHVQEVAGIEGHFQTVNLFVLVCCHEQQALIHQIFFVQRRTGKNDTQGLFLCHTVLRSFAFSQNKRDIYNTVVLSDVP